MSEDQRPARQWIVRINGVEQARINPGERVEIGRKPLRPLPDDGERRVETVDEGKSMSKRHATFSVSASGDASLRDLGSTNGSYIVRDNGSLMRVPLNTDFPLLRDRIRFQFGDVPVDFERVDNAAPIQTAAAAKPENAQTGGSPAGRGDADDAAKPVDNLFSYADGSAKPAGPNPSSLSVDDILDLRAGEPTRAFAAHSVRSKITRLHDQAIQEDRTVPETKGSDGATSDEPEESQPAVADRQPAASAPGGSASVHFTPTFAPGSVFDRVSRGDFDAHKPQVEIDGLNSDDAKTTRDYATQFQMAHHSELLPFLAMNPALYDDLYAWLSAQGNHDVDAALTTNEGYRHYRQTSGK